MTEVPIGTLVQEDHPDDEYWPGCSVWLRIARWTPGHGSGKGWLCVRSDAPGNVLEETYDGDIYADALTSCPVVGYVELPMAIQVAPHGRHHRDSPNL